MKILGISAFYHDSAVALIINGEIVAAAQEECFTSPFLDHYYAGGLNDTTDFPISKVDWGFSAAAGLALPPHPVVNIPARFTSNQIVVKGDILFYNFSIELNKL